MLVFTMWWVKGNEATTFTMLAMLGNNWIFPADCMNSVKACCRRALMTEGGQCRNSLTKLALFSIFNAYDYTLVLGLTLSW